MKSTICRRNNESHLQGGTGCKVTINPPGCRSQSLQCLRLTFFVWQLLARNVIKQRPQVLYVSSSGNFTKLSKGPFRFSKQSERKDGLVTNDTSELTRTENETHVRLGFIKDGPETARRMPNSNHEVKQEDLVCLESSRKLGKDPASPFDH